MSEARERSVAVLVPGGRGQLGSDLAACGDLVHPLGSADLDVADAAAVSAAVGAFAERTRAAGHAPVVCNAAAYTAVDAAESDVDAAFAVNARGPENLAAACRRLQVPLLHVSTDYVFSGDGDRPYRPDDVPAPRSVYGRSKLAGEQAVLDGGGWVVRTAWVYGATGSNFVRTMARLSASHPTVSVVDDQRGSPTWSADLAAGLLELAEAVSQAAPPRLLHCTSGGDVTWYGFARAIFTELGADPDRVLPCDTTRFPRPAPRPAYSVLSNEEWQTAGLTPLRCWREALSAAFERHRGQLLPSTVD